jgi:prefoldin subunit 5
MSQTPEERKIKRLEKSISGYKKQIETLNSTIKKLDMSLEAERNWRIEFQKLMKAVVLDDKLEEYHRVYW